MASTKHEGLVSLFRNHPVLAPELLQGPLGVALPAWNEIRVAPSDFTQVAPTEYRADLVVLLKKGRPVFAIVVEIQSAAPFTLIWPTPRLERQRAAPWRT